MTTAMPDRLSALDAEFLHIEDGVGHMHIGGACIFEGPPPSFEDIEALVRSKLHRIPRYRQRVRSVPLELGRPVWADDPHFDLRYHLRHTALPAPGDGSALRRLMGRVMSQPLDRDRPLWEAWLVEGLEDGHWAMLFKVHHCMVDGIAGVGLLTVLLDLTATAELEEPEPWQAAPEPKAAEKVLGAWEGLATDAFKQVRRASSVATRPADVARNVGDALKGASRLGRALTGTTPLSIDGSIGPHRSWAYSTAALSEVKEIRRAFGGTVNDVVLSAVTAGYSALLAERGDDIGTAVVRSLVPVSTRGKDGGGKGSGGKDGGGGPDSGEGVDNEVSMILFDLPVALRDPVERLAAVRAEMAELKASNMVEAGEIVTTVGNLAPPMLVGTVSRFIVRALQRLPQRSINTVTTNVPGPQFPLYCLGREMLDYLPFVPISHGLRVGTAILSYNGRLFFGVTGDAGSVPEVDVLADATTAAVSELLELARSA